MRERARVVGITQEAHGILSRWLALNGPSVERSLAGLDVRKHGVLHARVYRWC
jgi:hypothetical protein